MPVAVIVKSRPSSGILSSGALLRLCATIGLRNSRCSDEDVQKDYLQIE